MAEPRYRVNTGDKIIGITAAQKEKLMDAVFAPIEEPLPNPPLGNIKCGCRPISNTWITRGGLVRK